MENWNSIIASSSESQIWRTGAFAGEFGDVFIENTDIEGGQFPIAADTLLAILKSFLNPSHGENWRSKLTNFEQSHFDRLFRIIDNVQYASELGKEMRPGQENSSTLSLIQRIVSDISALAINDRIIIPGGWTNLGGGHAIVYIIERSSDSKFSFTVCNTGEGLGYHPMLGASLSGHKAKYKTAMFVGEIDENRVTSPDVWFMILRLKLHPSKHNEPKLFYEVILPHLAGVSVHEIVEQDMDACGHWETPQRAGTCFYRCTLSAIRYLMKKDGFNQKQQKLLFYFVRKAYLAATEKQLKVPAFIKEFNSSDAMMIDIACSQTSLAAIKFADKMLSSGASSIVDLREQEEQNMRIKSLVSEILASQEKCHGATASLTSPVSAFVGFDGFDLVMCDEDREGMKGVPVREGETTHSEWRLPTPPSSFIELTQAYNWCNVVIQAIQAKSTTTSVSVTNHQICALVEFVFLSFLPPPTPLSSRTHQAQCWEGPSVELPAQRKCLTSLWEVAGRYVAAWQSLPSDRGSEMRSSLTVASIFIAFDAISLLDPSPLAALLRRRGAPNVRCLNGCGGLREISEQALMTSPEALIARHAIIAYLEARRVASGGKATIFEFEVKKDKLVVHDDNATVEFVRDVRRELGLSETHLLSGPLLDDDLAYLQSAWPSLPELAQYRDTWLLFCLMMNPTNIAPPADKGKAFTYTDVVPQWSRECDKSGKFAEMQVRLCAKSYNKCNFDIANAFVSPAAIEKYTRKRDTTEEDILHLPSLPTFDVLNEQESELLFSYLIVPHIAAPLVLRFFADGRAGFLVKHELCALLESVLFEPRELTVTGAEISSSMLATVPVRNRSALATRFGVVMEELRQCPDAVLVPMKALVQAALKQSVGSFKSNSVDMLLFIVRLVYRLEGMSLYLQSHPRSLIDLHELMTSHVKQKLENWAKESHDAGETQKEFALTTHVGLISAISVRFCHARVGGSFVGDAMAKHVRSLMRCGAFVVAWNTLSNQADAGTGGPQATTLATPLHDFFCELQKTREIVLEWVQGSDASRSLEVMEVLNEMVSASLQHHFENYGWQSILPEERGKPNTDVMICKMVIECANGYQPSTRLMQTASFPGVTNVTIVFDPQSSTELDGDHVIISYPGCEQPIKLHGPAGPAWPGVQGSPPLSVPSHIFTVQFQSDASESDWGFKLTATAPVSQDMVGALLEANTHLGTFGHRMCELALQEKCNHVEAAQSYLLENKDTLEAIARESLQNRQLKPNVGLYQDSSAMMQINLQTCELNIANRSRIPIPDLISAHGDFKNVFGNRASICTISSNDSNRKVYKIICPEGKHGCYDVSVWKPLQALPNTGPLSRDGSRDFIARVRGGAVPLLPPSNDGGLTSAFNLPRLLEGGSVVNFAGTLFVVYSVGSCGWMSESFDELFAVSEDKSIQVWCTVESLELPGTSAQPQSDASDGRLLVMKSASEEKANECAWFEVVGIRTRRILQVFALTEEGRRIQRKLVFSTDYHFALKTLPPNPTLKNGFFDHAGDQFGDFYKNMVQQKRNDSDWVHSMTIKRYRIPIESAPSMNEEDEFEEFVSTNCLAGLVPESLLDQYQFWKTGPYTLRGYRRAGLDDDLTSILVVVDHRAHVATIHRLVKGTRQHTLLNMLRPADGEKDTLWILSDLLSRLDNISHILAWTSSDPLSLTERRNCDVTRIELPRLKMTFCHRPNAELGRDEYYLADHSDLVLCGDDLPEPVKRILGPFSNVLPLKNSSGQFSLLVPNYGLSLRKMERCPFLVQFLYDRSPSWSLRVQTRYYVYAVHPSLSFLEMPSLSAAMYWTLLCVMHHRYHIASRIIESSCRVDLPLTFEQRWILGQFPSNCHPDAHATRLLLALACNASPNPKDFEGPNPKDFEGPNPKDFEGYLNKLSHISLVCRLREEDEREIIRRCSKEKQPAFTVREACLNAAEQRLDFLSEGRATTRTDPLSDIYTNKVDNCLRNVSLYSFCKIPDYFEKYDRPKLPAVGPKAVGILRSFIEEREGGTVLGSKLENMRNGMHRSYAGGLGFPFLYEVVTGQIKLDLLGSPESGGGSWQLAKLLVQTSALICGLDCESMQVVLLASRALEQDVNLALTPSEGALAKFPPLPIVDCKIPGPAGHQFTTDVLTAALEFGKTVTVIRSRDPSTFKFTIPPAVNKVSLAPKLRNSDCSKRVLAQVMAAEDETGCLVVTADDVRLFSSCPLSGLRCFNMVSSETVEGDPSSTMDTLPFDLPSHSNASIIVRMKEDLRQSSGSATKFSKLELGGRYLGFNTIESIDLRELINDLRPIKDELKQHRDNDLLQAVAGMNRIDAIMNGRCPPLAQGHDNCRFRLLQNSGLLTLSWFELVVASLISSEQSSDLQKLNPFLDDRAVDFLNRATVGVLMRFVRSRQATSAIERVDDLVATIKAALASPSHGAFQAVCYKANELAGELTAKRHYTSAAFDFDPRFLVFEYITGFMLRRRQVELVNDFLGSFLKNQSGVHQMIMGAGKTQVITPLLTLMFANGSSLVTLVCPQPLLEQSRVQMRARFAYVLPKQILTFAFDRSSPWTNRVDDLKALVAKFESARRDRALVCTHPQAIKALFLKYMECLDNSPRLSENEQESQGGGGKAKPVTDRDKKFEAISSELQKVLNIWSDGTALMDEVDILLHPLKSELNFPIGQELQLPMLKARTELPMHLLDAFIPRLLVADNDEEKICEAIAAVIEQGKEEMKFQSTPHLILLSESYYAEHLRNLVGRWAFSWLRNQPSIKTILSRSDRELRENVIKTFISSPSLDDNDPAQRFAQDLAREAEEEATARNEAIDTIKTRDAEVFVVESTHPYANNADFYEVISFPGAVAYKITFDPRSKTEKNYDYIKFYKDDSHTSVWGDEKYSGANEWPGVAGKRELHIEAKNFILHFHSDGSSCEWGYLVRIVPVVTVDSSTESSSHIAVKLLNLARDWVCVFMPHVISKIHRVGFGLISESDVAQWKEAEVAAAGGDPEAANNIVVSRSRRLLAVPFVGKDVPSTSSEFAHPEVLIGLTIVAYRLNGMRIADVAEFLKQLQRSLMVESGPFTQRPSYQLFEEFKANIKGAEKLLSIDRIHITDNEQLPETAVVLQNDSAIVSYYLEQIVFPSVLKSRLLKLQANGVDLGGGMLFGRRFGFSGTPSDLLPREMGACEFEPGSEAEIVRILSSPKNVNAPEELRLEQGWHVDDILDRVAKGNYSALIDTGALITGLSAEQVARRILKLQEGKDLASKKEVCIFLDDRDRKMVVDSTSSRPYELDRCGVAMSKRFTFFDHIHTTGIDVKQPLDAVAVSTLGKDMILRDFAQGCWRMRGIGKGQRIDLIVVDEIAAIVQEVRSGTESGDVGVVDILAWLTSNSINSERVQLNQLKTQILANIWRKRAFSHVKELFASGAWTKNPKLMSQSIKIFVEKLEIDIPRVIPCRKVFSAVLRDMALLGNRMQFVADDTSTDFDWLFPVDQVLGELDFQSLIQPGSNSSLLISSQQAEIVAKFPKAQQMFLIDQVIPVGGQSDDTSSGSAGADGEIVQEQEKEKDEQRELLIAQQSHPVSDRDPAVDETWDVDDLITGKLDCRVSVPLQQEVDNLSEIIKQDPLVPVTLEKIWTQWTNTAAKVALFTTAVKKCVDFILCGGTSCLPTVSNGDAGDIGFVKFIQEKNFVPRKEWDELTASKQQQLPRAEPDTPTGAVAKADKILKDEIGLRHLMALRIYFWKRQSQFYHMYEFEVSQETSMLLPYPEHLLASRAYAPFIFFQSQMSSTARVNTDTVCEQNSSRVGDSDQSSGAKKASAYHHHTLDCGGRNRLARCDVCGKKWFYETYFCEACNWDICNECSEKERMALEVQNEIPGQKRKNNRRLKNATVVMLWKPVPTEPPRCVIISLREAESIRRLIQRNQALANVATLVLLDLKTPELLLSLPPTGQCAMSTQTMGEASESLQCVRYFNNEFYFDDGALVQILRTFKVASSSEQRKAVFQRYLDCRLRVLTNFTGTPVSNIFEFSTDDELAKCNSLCEQLLKSISSQFETTREAFDHFANQAESMTPDALRSGASRLRIPVQLKQAEAELIVNHALHDFHKTALDDKHIVFTRRLFAITFPLNDDDDDEETMQQKSAHAKKFGSTGFENRSAIIQRENEKNRLRRQREQTTEFYSHLQATAVDTIGDLVLVPELSIASAASFASSNDNTVYTETRGQRITIAPAGVKLTGRGQWWFEFTVVSPGVCSAGFAAALPPSHGDEGLGETRAKQLWGRVRKLMLFPGAKVDLELEEKDIGHVFRLTADLRRQRLTIVRGKQGDYHSPLHETVINHLSLNKSVVDAMLGKPVFPFVSFQDTLKLKLNWGGVPWSSCLGAPSLGALPIHHWIVKHQEQVHWRNETDIAIIENNYEWPVPAANEQCHVLSKGVLLTHGKWYFQFTMGAPLGKNCCAAGWIDFSHHNRNHCLDMARNKRSHNGTQTVISGKRRWSCCNAVVNSKGNEFCHGDPAAAAKKHSWMLSANENQTIVIACDLDAPTTTISFFIDGALVKSFRSVDYAVGLTPFLLNPKEGGSAIHYINCGPCSTLPSSLEGYQPVSHWVETLCKCDPPVLTRENLSPTPKMVVQWGHSLVSIEDHFRVNVLTHDTKSCPSVVADLVAVRSGRWFYEVAILNTQPDMSSFCVGFASARWTKGDWAKNKGIGNDDQSWGLFKNEAGWFLLHDDKQEQMNAPIAVDPTKPLVLSFGIDVDARKIFVSFNRKPKVQIFGNVLIGHGLTPGLSIRGADVGGGDVHFDFNIGDRPFFDLGGQAIHPLISDGFQPLVASISVREQATQWKCTFCTLENPVTVLVCAACEVKRPGTWECVCTLVNADSATICEACGCPQPVSPPAPLEAPSAPVPSPSPSPSPSPARPPARLPERSINDQWFDSGSFLTYFTPVEESYVVTSVARTIETSTGPMSCRCGDYIVDSPQFGKIAFTPAQFRMLKDDMGSNVCKSKKIIETAKLADHSGSIHNFLGEKVDYVAGEDFIVLHGSNDYGVAKKEAFLATYTAFMEKKDSVEQGAGNEGKKKKKKGNRRGR